MTNATATNIAPATGGGNPWEGDIRDIQGPVAIPAEWEWLLWLAVMAALVLLGWWLVRWWRRRLVATQAPVPVVPPHVLARQQLEAALQCIGEPYRFCILVSDAVRRYLQGHFGLPATDRTTEEFQPELGSSGRLPEHHQLLVLELLERCDLVKFARDRPTLPILHQIHESAVRFVQETEPRSGAPQPMTPSGEVRP